MSKLLMQYSFTTDAIQKSSDMNRDSTKIMSYTRFTYHAYEGEEQKKDFLLWKEELCYLSQNVNRVKKFIITFIKEIPFQEHTCIYLMLTDTEVY